MKWLLNTFWGRLYLVTQVACLGVTIFLCVKFIDEDRVYENRQVHPDYVMPTADIETIKREHSEARLRKSVYYLMPNLAVVALWAVGYFVAKGLPARKPDFPGK